MKVILKEHVKSLGNVGDIVNVTAGHARNFLIPRKLAILADDNNRRFVEDQQRRLAKKINAQKDQATAIKRQIDGLQFELSKRVGGNGKLFGAVTSTELANELKSRNIEVERRWINLDNPIKELGSFTVKVKIFADVEATFNVKVIMDAKQIEEMKSKSESRKLAMKQKEEDEKRAQAKAAEAGAQPAEGEEESEGLSPLAALTSTAPKAETAAAAAEKSAKDGKKSSKKEKAPAASEAASDEGKKKGKGKK